MAISPRLHTHPNFVLDQITLILFIRMFQNTNYSIKRDGQFGLKQNLKCAEMKLGWVRYQDLG